MLILSFDTSSPRLVLALARDRALLAAEAVENKGTHMKNLLPAAAQLLDGQKIKVGEVEAFAAVTGPGSFTGLRIGIATAQALAFAGGRPCLALNSLDAAAYAYEDEAALTAAMYEARNRRVYRAAYRGGRRVIEAGVGPIHEFAEALCRERRADEKLIFCGDETAARYAEDDEVLKVLGSRPETAPELYYRPEVLAELARREAEAGRFLRPEALLPEYYAPTQAERNFGVFI